MSVVREAALFCFDLHIDGHMISVFLIYLVTQPHRLGMLVLL